jgi:hypothetical protein
MRKSGVIINDNFGSPLFPEAGKAWDEFFKEKMRVMQFLILGKPYL